MRSISMDFIEGLPHSKGKSVIMVVVDRLTKYAHFTALAHPFSAEKIAAVFIQEGTKLCHSSAYHPQSDGQTEVINRILEQYLLATLATNPPLGPHGSHGPNFVHAVDTALIDRDQLLNILKSNIQMAQNRMKVYADKHRTERHFQVGDYVYLRLQSYRQHSVMFRQNHKLSPRFYGPYKIAARLGTTSSASTQLPPMSSSGAQTWEPEAILERGLFKHRNAPLTKWLIKWKGYPASDATWEEA
ncbi:unnamed protein product, partial [Prunus brigantina]